MRRLVTRLSFALALAVAVPLAAPVPSHAQSARTPGAAKPYFDAQLESDAVRVRAAIRKDLAEDAKGHSADQLVADGLRALGSNPSAAVDDLGAAISLGRDDFQVWLRLADAAATAAADEKDDDRRSQLNEWALPAAYLAYKRAATKKEEATALAAVGAIFAKRESWRDALNAYAASLKANDIPAVRQVYQPLREEHGFRITDYKIDSDSASPRACFQVSEPLIKGRTDLASFVAVDGSANAAVSVEDQQLCVEGLSHGQHYAITVREGLPSAVDETLLKSAHYDIYVRDRSPQVHFVGQTYVLPRVGPEGIPVVSVNTDKVDVTILRIGDRNLAPTVRSEDFLRQLYSYRLKTLASDEGAKVWSGTLDVENRLNSDVTTAFPVLEAVGHMQPGVYLMEASAHAEAGAEETSGLRATQWFVVSDLGLTALSAETGLTTLVRSLAKASPVAGVEVKLIARNNEVLGTATTDAGGVVRFDPGLSRGEGGNAPELVVASTPAGDYNFLSVAQPPFDLTDRGVKGRPAPKGLDAFVYAERGVYRSGETVHLTALVRSTVGDAAAGLPLTLVVKRPDGVESRRVTLEDAALGGHTLDLPLMADASSGTWHVEAYADPKGDSIGETTFLVEDYVPERLAFDLTPATKALPEGQPARIATSTRYLYGAPGKNLEIDGETVVEAAEQPVWPALAGYTAGLSDESVETVTTPLPEKVRTDAAGNATVIAPIPVIKAARPLEAKIVLRVGEPGGRSIERNVILPIQPRTGLIGVRKTFGSLHEGDSATFDVIAVGPDGQRVARPGLHWSMVRVDNDYQWYRDGSQWNYERVKSSKRVGDGTVDVGADAPATISTPVGYGSYRLDLSSDDAAVPPTSISFTVGWSGEAQAQTPDLLDVTLDKPAYRAGETMKVQVHARFAGEATLAVANGGVRLLQRLDLAAGDNSVSVPVDGAWGTGAYAVVLAHRPLDVQARRMPGRAIGLAWFAIDPARRALEVKIETPAKIQPRSTLTIPLTLAGLDPGEEAAVTVSAVDVGILSLTRYETPKPNDYFFGQYALGTDIRDLYGYLIDGLGIARGGIRSGGDSGGELQGEKPTQPPLARFSGIVRVGPDGKAQVSFDIPAFNGTVRVAAVAWTRTRAGSAEADVVVRDPVVVAGTLPRFLNVGDRARVHFEYDNVEAPAGSYTFQLQPSGPWIFPADALSETLQLGAGARTGLDLPMTAAGLGRAEIGTRLTGQGLDLAQEFALRIGSGAPTVSRRDIRSIEPGTSLTVSADLLADFIPGTGRISVSASTLGSVDVPGLLVALDRYPVGCSEQIVSRALPLLYVDKIAPTPDLALDSGAPERIRSAITTLLARQSSEGSFGLWTADNESNDMWLNAYVTDFLTRVREAGYAVPRRAFESALDKLRNYVANNAEAKDDDAIAFAYSIYVLARNGQPVLGDLRYQAATRMDAYTTPLSRAQIGAALALLGDRTRAAQVFDTATAAFKSEKEKRDYRSDYGSELRDAAAVLALVAETGLSTDVARARAIVDRTQPYPFSTQEEAWLVLAAQALDSRAKGLSLTVNGEPHTGALYRSWTDKALDGKTFKIANTGSAPLRVVVSTAGQLPNAEPAASEGYTIERRYYRLNGTEVDPSTVTQTERLVVVLKVTEEEATKARLLLTDPLPAGFEIDNPDLVSGGSTDALSFIDDSVKPSHTEFRDDRFTAAFDRDSEQSAFFTVAYIVRAVTPGRFVHPAATIEDMYRPERFGRTTSGFVEVKSGS